MNVGDYAIGKTGQDLAYYGYDNSRVYKVSNLVGTECQLVPASNPTQRAGSRILVGALTVLDKIGFSTILIKHRIGLEQGLSAIMAAQEQLNLQDQNTKAKTIKELMKEEGVTEEDIKATMMSIDGLEPILMSVIPFIDGKIVP